MVLLHLHCTSGASLRFAVCHTACSSYGIPHSSFCGLHAASFISSSVTLHSTTFAALQLLHAWAYPQPATKQITRGCTSHCASHPTILTGFHCASLRHPFTSAAFSPPAANNLARLAATGCVTGLRWHIP